VVRMDPMDAVFMMAEQLSNPLHIAALLIMTPPEDAGPGFVDDLHRSSLAAVGKLDLRLRRRPHQGLDTGGTWVWRDVDHLDANQHMLRRTLPPGSGQEELWRLISEVHAAPLDRSRPMWESYLIDGFDDNRFALYAKVHHSVMDGLAGFRLIEKSLTSDPGRRSMPPLFTELPAESIAHTAAGSGLFPNLISIARSGVGVAAATVTFLRRLVEGEVSNLVEGLTGNATLPFGAPYTRFNGPLGRDRAVAAVSVSKARLQAVQNAAGATGNDVTTALAAGVLRYWLTAHDELPSQSLVAICPITLRARESGSEDGHANAFGAVMCPLGTDLAEPAERLALIHKAMTEAKRHVATWGSGPSLLVAAPNIAPTVLLPQVPFTPKVRPGFNLPISNTPGPRTEMYWNGAHVDELYPISAIYDGIGLNITLCSYADRVGFGYVAGRDMMPDIETLIPLTERALSDLEIAVGVKS
jgi:diacylglycerol O-acyltransferase